MRTFFFFFVIYVVVPSAVAREMQESGPVVNGRPMSFWLRTWVEKTTHVSRRVEAQRAFEQADTNVIPYLLDELTAGDVVDKSGTASVEEVRVAIERTIAAEAALRYMGSRVTSSIPALAKLIASTNYGAVEAAAEILSDLGAQGAHLLVSGLTNSNKEAREAIPRVLRHMATRSAGTNLLAELPALFNSLEGLAESPAFDCCFAINQSGAPVTNVVAGFACRLQSTNAVTRYVCAHELGELGPIASPAVPNLEKLRKDPEEYVRGAADWALARIQERARP